MKKNKMPLSKLNFISIISITIIISFAFIFIGVYEYKDYHSKKIEELEKSYIYKHKLLIKEEVSSLVNTFRVRNEENYNELQFDLSERINNLINIYETTQKSNTGLSEKEILIKFYDIIDKIIFDDKKSYFYIFNVKGEILYHQANKKYIGVNIFKTEQNDEKIFSLIKEAIKYGSSKGFYTRKNYAGTNMVSLYSKSKQIEGTSLFVSTSIYAETINKKLRESFFKEVQNERFGVDKNGYFWISNHKDEMVYHPIQKNLIGKNLKNLVTQDGVSLFLNINKVLKNIDEGYISYNWTVPQTGEIAPKISFVKEVGIWNWRVGAGFYFKDYEKSIEREKAQLMVLLNNLILKTIALIFTLFLIIVFIAWIISKKFKEIEDSQIKHFSLLEQYRTILDKSAIVSKTDLKGILTEVNSNFENISGFTRDELIGKNHRLIKHPSTPRETFEDLWMTLKKGKVWEGVIRNQPKDRRSSYYCQTTIFPILDEVGVVKEYIAVFIDITKIVKQKDKINKIFLTDSLTSLGNRVKLLENVSKATNSQLALLDIDRFTEVNDAYGNKVGDIILREVAKELFRCAREFSLSIYRIHADVFAIYSKSYQVDKFESIITELIKKISSKTYDKNKSDVMLSFTAGLAVGDDNIMVYADMALKSAKKNKKNLVVYDAKNSILNEYEDNLIWIKKLSSAIEEKKIVPFYQPIYNYKEEKIEKYEVLMRYIENDGAEVSPFKFLDIAKKTKVYPHLTRSIVSQAVDYFKDFPLIEFSINLTLEDLLNEDTMQYIYSIIFEYKMFENLVIEIVESEELVGFEQVKSILHKFKEKGTKIAIDDFGSGFSNYKYLIELEVDYIKIDGSIIRNLTSSQATIAVVKSIVEFAKKSNIKTIGEFVSNREVAESARELKVDYAQGYFYGKPQNHIDG